MTHCQTCKPRSTDGRKRPAIKTQTAFKGDFTEATCEECGAKL